MQTACKHRLANNRPSGAKTFPLYDARLTLTNSALVSNLVTFDGLTTNGIGNALALYNTTASLANTNVFFSTTVRFPWAAAP